MFYSTTSFLQNLHGTFSFFLLFADPLGYFLFNCRISIKLSINQVLQSLQIIIWYNKNIIWYKYLLLFDRAFSELFGRNFNKQFFRYRSWFETFLYLLIGDGGGAPLKA